MGLYSKYIFPRLLDRSLGTGAHQRERREALASARGHALEIGFGTGLNLPHYPPPVYRLTAIEPERMLEGRVAKRIAHARMPVELRRLDATGRLPFDDDTFDTVVTTWTLCSIEDVAPALSEIRRVLKPEGRYLFFEHGRSEEASVARRQDLFNPVHKLLAGGCSLNRPIDRLIRSGGLNVIKLERYRMPELPKGFGEMYRGVALKN
ncbi:MAG TPA: class I SAM-dependent methyltransferase [Blastocatellia bacterium]|jgi:SAM-dependent methyltransferase|nr:class I SAM-dependent methyltransferase [Blastocatellia bacterium]